MKKIVLSLTLALVVTCSVIIHAYADCVPEPENQKITFYPQTLPELNILSANYGILSQQDVDQLIAADPEIEITICTATVTEQDFQTTTQATLGSVYLSWHGPILGQCGYQGPGHMAIF